MVHLIFGNQTENGQSIDFLEISIICKYNPAKRYKTERKEIFSPPKNRTIERNFYSNNTLEMN